jgi:hypothetical protein
MEFARAVLDESAAAAIAGHIRRNGIDGERRVQVYRNNYRINLGEALAAVFPVTQRLVGEAFFQQTARDYLTATGSTSGDIHRYGDGFPAYLAHLPALAEYPYLGDVARLEWAYHCVFHTAIAGPLDLAALRGVAPADYPSLRFAFQPAARLIASDFPVLRIWQVNLDEWTGDRDVRLDQGAARVLVRREPKVVALEPLGAGDYALLETLRCGAPLVDAHSAATAAAGDFDLGEALRRFVAIGVLTGFSTGASPDSRTHSTTMTEV